ncbi:MAG: cAMP-binding protein [Bacteroidetes bacterium]|nr:cAMP-binding protein [Bacteroidota bacterium]
MYPNLITHIRKFVDLSDEQADLVLEHAKLLQIKKNDMLLRGGQVCRASYFVEKGGLCMYFINDKGVEKITHFVIENWWLSDYLSLGSNNPSAFNIRAFENAEVYSLDFHAQELLCRKLPQLERYFRLMMQRGYGAHQFRIKLMREFNSEQYYHHFRDLYPTFIQRIPQYMLASFLGLTPEYLSELRKKDAPRTS